MEITIASYEGDGDYECELRRRNQ